MPNILPNVICGVPIIIDAVLVGVITPQGKANQVAWVSSKLITTLDIRLIRHSFSSILTYSIRTVTIMDNPTACFCR